jgi:hypothetical protein
MDHRRPLGPVQHDHFDHVACPVWTEDKVADRALADIFHDQGVPDGMLDVFRADTMSTRRSEDVHTPQSYYES